MGSEPKDGLGLRRDIAIKVFLKEILPKRPPRVVGLFPHILAEPINPAFNAPNIPEEERFGAPVYAAGGEHNVRFILGVLHSERLPELTEGIGRKYLKRDHQDPVSSMVWSHRALS